jgi:hypothetical protein
MHINSRLAVNRFVGQRFGGGKAIHAVRELLDLLAGLLHNIDEVTRRAAFHRGDFFVHIWRQPIRGHDHRFIGNVRHKT